MSDKENTTVYVVTGGNRGLGNGLVRALLKRPDTTVIATVRNEESRQKMESEATNLEKGENSKLHIVPLDLSRAPEPQDIREAFKAVHVDHIDVLINNAGFAHPMIPIAQTTAADLRAAFEINAIAPLMVFQALWPLLQKAAAAPPKLIMVTSSVGSIAEMEPVPGGAYGPSRAAHNWITKALHQENRDEKLIAIALHPGWVQTRMGQYAADQWGFGKAPPVTVEESVRGMLKVIDEADEQASDVTSLPRGAK
ncbi:hypothetical protein BKA67DRAFT_534736 [Truncatella angustata]|uniref:Uncharacterized protein n=1 Tax=Truncatella angustata TaxID=152316 RepID=A0A9P8UPA5_9PEZI|nr:uncharacterized protein BKA67DRAFT_534736 [Truncatella angustata]KAH6655830.1 hypothetical protein BKA67DRAFT_534736 [Truncatella angustata]